MSQISLFFDVAQHLVDPDPSLFNHPDPDQESRTIDSQKLSDFRNKIGIFLTYLLPSNTIRINKRCRVGGFFFDGSDPD